MAGPSEELKPVAEGIHTLIQAVYDEKIQKNVIILFLAVYQEKSNLIYDTRAMLRNYING